jgi:diguanylate cyclase (GGDEF)-like protein
VTGINGHRYFQERLQLEIDLARRHEDPVAVVVIDIDDFRTMNDAHGHSYGDSTLRLTAAALAGSVAAGDAVCRLGGDQFGAVLRGAGAQRALTAADRMRQALGKLRWPDGSPLTASVGVSLFPDDGTDRTELVRAAERACVWAKCRGKDRVTLYEAATVEALPCQERLDALRSRDQLATVRALASAVDAREPHACYHATKVATFARLLGEELGFDDVRLELLEIAAFVHDVGKVGIPDAIIQKPGALNAEESRRVREHASLSERIVSFTGVDEILPWVRHHHERWDGTGYPDGIAGPAIPLESRIIAVCDAFEVMTAGKPGRVASSLGSALQEIDLCMGTQFDPEVAEAFIRVVSTRRPLLGSKR